ncbi:MAG: HTH-type transcriptional regulator MalT [Anaerolineae bacterium]|nr:HTH-type transcriptional regulator MalT [Anaerolineae bacterium]
MAQAQPTDLVARPHLLKRLNEGVARPPGVILVSAPAGFGKTTLISAWFSGRMKTEDGRQKEEDFIHPFNVAWLSLDEEDNDPARFLTYLLAAFQKTDPALGQAAQEMLQAQGVHSLSPEALITTLINDIATNSCEWMLVLDDYHLIQTPTIHSALTFLIDHQPPNLHLVLTSRADPPLPLARLRARGRLLEVRAADLRFTPDEAKQFLNQVMGLQLSPADSAALEARTEGWVAGLQLAALSLRGLSDASGFIQAFSGSHRHIVDYLAEEVLHRQPEAVQTFLLQTAILDRLTGPLTDVLTGQDNGQEMLETLERANLFIIPLDQERRWYRYHHLFAELLRFRLQRLLPEQLPELHRRAAEWYEANELVNEAIHHAVAAGDVERLTRLVTTHAQPRLQQGEILTVTGWLAALPQAVLLSQPRLCLVQAWVLHLTRRQPAIEPFLQAAEQGLSAADPDAAAIQGEILTIRAYGAVDQNQFQAAIDLARQALAQLPEANVFARSTSALALGHALHILGETEPAVAAVTESVSLCRAAGNALGALYGMGIWAALLGQQGRLRQADNILQEAFQWVAEYHWQQVPPVGVLYLRLADIRREQNELAAAEQLLQQGIQRAELGALVVAARSYAYLARVKQNQGDWETARAVLEKLGQLSRQWEMGHEVAYFAAFRAYLALLRGELAQAETWAAQIAAWQAGEVKPYPREFELLVLARLYLTQAQAYGEDAYLLKALVLLEWLIEQAEQAGRMGTVVEILVLTVVARAAQSDPAGALVALERALTLAAPEGYVRIFLDEGPAMADLLRTIQTQSGWADQAYVAKLLAAFEAENQAPQPAAALSTLGRNFSGNLSPAALIEPLSDRELEVLRLMAEGYSNREIAEKLIFTVATAKKHAEHIYGKLDVRSRTQAIARAQELNLI